MISYPKLISQTTKIYNAESLCYKGDIAKKVVREYFRVVKQTMLTGQEFKFPRSFGYGKIIKRKRKHTDKISTSTPKFGFDYDIRIDSPSLDRYHFEFKAALSFRRELRDKIRKGKDYIEYVNQ